MSDIPLRDLLVRIENFSQQSCAHALVASDYAEALARADDAVSEIKRAMDYADKDGLLHLGRALATLVGEIREVPADQHQRAIEALARLDEAVKLIERIATDAYVVDARPLARKALAALVGDTPIPDPPGAGWNPEKDTSE